MNKGLFQIIYNTLLNTAIKKQSWIKVDGEIVSNTVAKGFCDSNYLNVAEIYEDCLNSQVVIVLKKGHPIFFYKNEGEQFYQCKSLKEIESYLIFILIRMVQENWKTVSLEAEISYLKDCVNIYKDDEKLMYKQLFDESLEKIEKLEKKLKSKTKAYHELRTQYDKLLEKNNWVV